MITNTEDDTPNTEDDTTMTYSFSSSRRDKRVFGFPMQKMLFDCWNCVKFPKKLSWLHIFSCKLSLSEAYW